MQFINDPRNSKRDCFCYIGDVGSMKAHKNLEVLLSLLRESGNITGIRTGKMSKGCWDLGYYDTLIIEFGWNSQIQIVFGSPCIGPGSGHIRIFGYDLKKDISEILSLFDGFYYPERTWPR